MLSGVDGRGFYLSDTSVVRDVWSCSDMGFSGTLWLFLRWLAARENRAGAGRDTPVESEELRVDHRGAA